MFRRYILLIFIFSFYTAQSQQPAFLSFMNDSWVENQMSSMNLQEKIGQLVMIEVYPDQNEQHRENIIKALKRYNLGGLLIMRGSPAKTTAWISSFQEAAPIPLIIAMDAENGAAFRIDSLMNFPTAQALGAVSDDSLLYRMGRTVAMQLQRLGVNMNFAPVADVNTNPSNPIINFRSFGENKHNVRGKTVAYAMGMQDAGVAAVAKHFPGHGDTRSDSHHTLPVIQHSASRMDSVELFPFRHLVTSGIAGIMTAHISVPVMDSSGKPASLSLPVIQNILRQNLGFKGLVITDAMNMKGVTLPSGQAEVQALKAGNDMLEFVTNLPGTISAIENAVKNGTIPAREIDEKCRRVLALKRWMNLHQQAATPTPRSTSRNDSPAEELVSRQLTEASLTVLRNRDLLPLMRLDTLKIATLSIGETDMTPFQKMVSRYTDAVHFHTDSDISLQETEKLLQELRHYNLVIAGIHGLRSYPGRKYGITDGQANLLKSLVNRTRLITLFFGNAYALQYLGEIENSGALVLAYQDTPLAQELAVQMIFGATGATGRIPVTPDNRFPAGSGIDVKKNGRLKYTIPEEVGISSEVLGGKIEEIIQEGLREKAFPGSQVLVAVDGKIIYNRSFGYYTYDSTETVTNETLYDWASVTKVTGPLPALMKLTGEEKFNLNGRLQDYLPQFAGSNKGPLKIKDILTHQAQLRPIIPLWQSKFARDSKLRDEVFTPHPFSENSIRISSGLYMDRKYIDDFYNEIRESTLLPAKRFTYTCLGFHLWPLVIEKLTSEPYEEYLQKNFYSKLGATTITYNAYRFFPQSRIAPTETDDYFRMETLRGFVHDEGAALLGGISGNAGLFGSANDLAKMFQMYLWKGYYGGEQLIKQDVLEEFTRVQFPGNNNRRGLGFDKPEIKNHLKNPEDAYPCPGPGENSFGHTGYTGTFVWADPDKGILCILLTNRVYPTRNNNKLSALKIRGDLLQSVYDSMPASVSKN